jgi:hypothetical protein
MGLGPERRSSAPAWTAGRVGALGAVAVIGIAIRVVLWPSPGFAGDLDQFVLWVHGIRVDGLPEAYRQNLSFPAVMAWIWGVLAAVQPAFATATDAADPAIRALMKVPATLADLGLAAGVAWWFRDRPRVAVAGAAAILFVPATWYVSAWWGQYESVYVLVALLALLAVRGGRPLLAAGLIAAATMTKPQALPLLVPFAAWFLATQGLRGTVRAGLVGVAVSVALWLPFLPAGGPLDYLDNLATYQGSIFNVLSLRAWNPWWLVQELGAGGAFVDDGGAIAGPVTLRLIGLAVAGLLELAVFLAVLRRPSTERLALGLAASALVAFLALTTMHERYAYPALVFLLLVAGRRSGTALWLVLAATFSLNLVIAVPPEGWTIPASDAIRVVGMLGAVVMTAIGAIVLGGVLDREGEAVRVPAGPPRGGAVPG